MRSPWEDQYGEKPLQSAELLSTVQREANDTATDPAETLAELYCLLNDYAPQWYTEGHYLRTTEVLRRLGRV